VRRMEGKTGGVVAVLPHVATVFVPVTLVECDDDVVHTVGTVHWWCTVAVVVRRVVVRTCEAVHRRLWLFPTNGQMRLMLVWGEVEGVDVAQRKQKQEAEHMKTW